jgi:hypothetical protein
MYFSQEKRFVSSLVDYLTNSIQESEQKTKKPAESYGQKIPNNKIWKFSQVLD